jgi:hypothetical protein
MKKKFEKQATPKKKGKTTKSNRKAAMKKGK